MSSGNAHLPQEAFKSLESLRTEATPVVEVASSFSKFVTSPPSGVDDRLWEGWNAFFDIVGKTPPEDQQRLVDFLVELRKTTAKDEEGRVVRHDDGELWKDLPALGWVARELWNFGTTPLKFVCNHTPAR